MHYTIQIGSVFGSDVSIRKKQLPQRHKKGIISGNCMKKISICEQGLIGTLFQPNQQEKLPAIILVPGSDGGIPEVFAEKPATEGYIVFALG